MARPRVFVSSTYYDLKHIRASLENFIESLGFDAVLRNPTLLNLFGRTYTPAARDDDRRDFDNAVAQIVS